MVTFIKEMRVWWPDITISYYQIAAHLIPQSCIKATFKPTCLTTRPKTSITTDELHRAKNIPNWA